MIQISRPVVKTTPLPSLRHAASVYSSRNWNIKSFLPVNHGLLTPLVVSLKVVLLSSAFDGVFDPGDVFMVGSGISSSGLPSFDLSQKINNYKKSFCFIFNFASSFGQPCDGVFNHFIQ